MASFPSGNADFFRKVKRIKGRLDAEIARKDRLRMEMKSRLGEQVRP